MSGLALSGASLPLRVAQAQETGSGLRAHNLALAVPPKEHIRCRSTEDVTRAVKDLTARGTSFSIYSSGHCFAGFSLGKEAVIDVSPMSQIEMDRARVTAGPGTQVGALTRALGAAGRMLPMGFCQTVALGGHLGCGGIGHLSRSHGLLADQLEAATVVLADREVVTASEDSHPDLFWALRGGGPGSFGIVTEMTFRTLPDRPATHISALVRLPVAEAARVAAAWQGWSVQLPEAVATTLEVFSPDFENIQLRLAVIASEDGPDLRGAIVGFMSAVPWQEAPSVTQGLYSQLADVFWPRDYYPSEALAYGAAFAETPTNVNVWAAMFTQVVQQKAPRQHLFIERLGGAIARVSSKATGYAHRDAAFLWQIEGRFNRLHDAEEQTQAVEDLTQILRRTTGGASYAGYPNPRLADWPTAYWGGNYARLQQVKTAYDPGNVFSHAQSVRPT